MCIIISGTTKRGPITGTVFSLNGRALKEGLPVGPITITCFGRKLLLLTFFPRNVVLNRLVPFHIIDVRTKRSPILLIREGKTTCSAPWCHSINSDESPVSSQLVSSKQPTVAGVNYHNRI